MIDRKHCQGCYNDFYNGRPNCTGKDYCWSRESAELIMRKRVSMDERPPWKRKPELKPSCYTQKGFIFVRPEVER